MESNETKDQLIKEIEKLESKEIFDDRDTQRLEQLKDKLAELETILDGTPAAVAKYRALSKEEIKKIKDLMRSKDFLALSAEQQIDQMAVILTSGFGFGSFNPELITSVFAQGEKTISLDLHHYLEDSQDVHSGQKKFIAVGGGAYKVNRLYILGLSQAKAQNRIVNEEPIRKKVVGSAPEPVKPKPQEPVRRVSARPVKNPAPTVAKTVTAEAKNSSEVKESSKFGQRKAIWLLLVAVLFAVILVVLFV